MTNHVGKRIFFLLVITMGVLLSPSSAKAGDGDWSRNYQVETTIDLIHPRSVPVWKDVRFGGDDVYMYLTCNSKSDTSLGACPTESLGGYGTTGSNVTLRFTNLKTKATVDLTVTGKWWTACSGRSGDGFTGIWGLCNGSSIVFDTNLTKTELRKLPYGGRMGCTDAVKNDVIGAGIRRGCNRH